MRKIAAAVAAHARMGRGRKRLPRSHPPANSRIGVPPALGTRASGESIRRVGLATTEELAVPGGTSSVTEGSPFASLIPWLTSLSTAGSPSDPVDSKPTRYLGLPTLPMKVVPKVWFVEMEELLPAPRALCLVEQGVASSSLQESLVGALNQFQAQQQTAGDGYHDVGPLLLTLYGGTVKESARDGAEHGGAPPHGSAPLSKSVLPAGMARV